MSRQVKNLLKALLGVFIFLFIGCAALIFFDVHEIKSNYMTQCGIQLEKLKFTGELKENIVRQTSSIRAYILYKDDKYLRDFNHYAALNNRMEKELIDIIRPDRKAMATEILDLNNQYTEICLNEIIPRVHGGDQANLEAGQHKALDVLEPLSARVNELENLRLQDTGQLIDSTTLFIQDLLRNILIYAIIALIMMTLAFMAFNGKLLIDNNYYYLMLKFSNSGIVTLDKKGRIINLNPRAEQIFEISEQNIKMRRLKEVFPDDKRDSISWEAGEVAKSLNSRCKVEKKYIAGDGWEYTLMMDYLPLISPKGKYQGQVIMLNDITERKTVEERLQGISLRDGLTSIYNHRYIHEQLKIKIDDAKLSGESFGFIIIDIDNFKYCNERLGYQTGDSYLKIMSNILTECVGHRAVIGRYGGDKFAVLLNKTDHIDAFRIGDRIRLAVQDYEFPHSNLLPDGRLTVSIGAAIYPDDALSINELIKKSDEALYKAKRKTKNKVEIFFSTLQEFQRELDQSDTSLINTVKTLLTLVNAKDRYTYDHSEQVVYYSELIARAMDLSPKEIRNIKISAFLHDIGKIEIGHDILNKMDPLTDEEFELIKMHSSHGANFVRSFKSLSESIPLVLHHHERYDGKGYPDGLSGDRIPLGARIIAVADSFDAMTTNRPYRKSMTLADAVAELKKNAGTQFDPDVVSIFIKILRKKGANCA